MTFDELSKLLVGATAYAEIGEELPDGSHKVKFLAIDATDETKSRAEHKAPTKKMTIDELGKELAMLRAGDPGHRYNGFSGPAAMLIARNTHPAACIRDSFVDAILSHPKVVAEVGEQINNEEWREETWAAVQFFQWATVEESIDQLLMHRRKALAQGGSVLPSIQKR
jgi:hypothetical protein